MLKVGEVKEIHEMKGAGRSIRGIAQELDVSRNTVRRYLKSPEAMRPRLRPLRGSKLDPYAEHIDRRMAEGLENCRVLDREVRALGYQGSYSTVLQYVRPRRQYKQPEARCGSRPPPGCRYSGSSGQCYSQTSSHSEHPWFALVSVCGGRVNHPLCLQQGPVRGQPFPVAGALDDDLVAGVGEAVQGAVAEDGVLKDAQPFLHCPVAGEDKAGDPVAVEDELVEVGGLLGREPVEPQVVHDQQVRSQEGPEGSVHRVVHPGLGHGPEEVVGVDEADRMPGPDGGVSQGLGQEALADPCGSHQQDVLVLVQELQGEDGVQEPAVECDGRRPVEVLQPAGLLEAGALQPQFGAPVSPAVDLVAEDDLRNEA